MGTAARVYFRGGSLWNREVARLNFLTLILFSIEVALSFTMLPLAFLFFASYPFEAITMLTLPIALAPVLAYSWRLGNILSRVQVLEGALALGRRIVSLSDIRDVKLLTEIYEDLEVEGGPVVGYGMYGYGYGYSPAREVTRRRITYPAIQLFYEDDRAEEIKLAPREFWPFVKAILKSAEHSPTKPTWIRKFEKLEPNQ